MTAAEEDFGLTCLGEWDNEMNLELAVDEYLASQSRKSAAQNTLDETVVTCLTY